MWTFAYSAEHIEFARLLKENFGWMRFNYDADVKGWVFSEPIFVDVLRQKYPTINVSPEVYKIVKEALQIQDERIEKEHKLAEIQNKKDSDLVIEGMKRELYPYQKVGVEFLMAAKGRAIIADQPGCISGDAIIIVNRGGCARKMQLRDLYSKFNAESGTWDLSIPTNTRSLAKNGVFKLNSVGAVLFKGVQQTMVINAVTDEGKEYSVTCTPDHRIATSDGWVEASKLSIGGCILVNGDSVSWCDICKKDTHHCSYKDAKFYGECKSCIYRNHRNNKTFPNNEVINKDGYIEITQAYFHPSLLKRIKQSKNMLKHVMVYEAYQNDLSLSEWLHMCKTNSIPAGSFIIDSSKFCVHHIDGNKQNNSIENLELLTHTEHAKKHGTEKYSHFGNIVAPCQASVVSITLGCEVDVYDIQMSGEDKNFVADGVVVHNCGKTSQAIAYIQHLKMRRALIVAPASVKFVWKNEISKCTSMKSYVIDSKTDFDDIDASVQCWIINYELLQKFLPKLLKIHFDAIVADEAHLIKNPSAKRTKALRQLSRNVDSTVLLTGTPLLSRPVELFSLLNIVDPKEWKDYYSFTRRYCAGHNGRFGYDASGASNIPELRDKIKSYFIRREKSDVLASLPPKRHIKIPVALNPEYGRKYQEAAANFARYLRMHSGKQPEDIAKALQAEKLSQLNVLRHLCAMGKLGAATEIIDSIVESGEKILIFSSFMEPLELLKKRYGSEAVMITGMTAIEDREAAVNQFQNNSKVRVFLGGIKSAGVGLTLTASSTVMFLDISWNPADHQQAQDRVHRPGQKAESVDIYWMHADDTIDADLEQVLADKQEIFDQLIEGKALPNKSSDVMESAVNRILNNY